MKQKILALIVVSVLGFGFAEARAQSGDEVQASLVTRYLKENPDHAFAFVVIPGEPEKLLCTDEVVMEKLNAFRLVLHRKQTMREGTTTNNNASQGSRTPNGKVIPPSTKAQ